MGYSHLLPSGRLAQGSAPPLSAHLPFDVVVLAAREYQPDLPGYAVLRAPLDDSGPPPSLADRAVIRRTAREIARLVRSHKRVLVTCWQGRNRSGVLSGLAMRELGFSGHEAARRIQLLRDGLTNPHFYAMVVGR
jgi:protein-tyrosine phosphatase